MNKSRLVALCIVLLLLFGLAAYGLHIFSLRSEEDQKLPVSVSPMPEATEQKTFGFNSKTVYGNSITSSVFMQNDLTLINIFATWCSPCVEEIPFLQEIDAELDNVGVVGIVADTYDTQTGMLQQEAIETAKEIAEKTGAKYPFIIPDNAFMEDHFENAAVMFPISYIVNQDGKVVLGPIGGAHTKDEWLDVIQQAMEALPND